MNRRTFNYNVKAFVHKHFPDARVSSAGKERIVNCLWHDDSGRHLYINVEKGVYTCLAGETRVITWDGTKEIRELAGNEHKILTSKGWCVAPIKSFGIQKLFEITLTRNGITKIIRATEGHRWFVGRRYNYKEYTTNQLMPGDRLAIKLPPGSHWIVPSPQGIAHGFTFGDGTLTTQGSRVYLFGAKDAPMLKYFDLNISYNVSNEEKVPGVRFDGLPRFFKKFPDLEEHTGYLYGFLSGWFAADGCVSDSGNCTLHSSDEKKLQFARDLATRIGIVTHGISKQLRLGYGKEKSYIYKMSISRSSLCEDFFQIKHHKARWKKFRKVKERLGWVVDRITSSEISEEVFCAVVPKVHNFVLEDNILTGNCFSCGAKGNFYALVKRLSKSGDISGELAKYVMGSSYEEPVAVDKKPFLLPKGFFRLASDKLDDKSDSAKRARKYLSNRGFSDSIIYYYRMGHCIGGQFDRRVVVPVYDDYDDLVSFIARDYTGTQEPKVLTPKSEKGSHGVKDYVFNLYEAAKTRHLIITEGVFSALSVGHSGVALFGKKATDIQINKIVSVKPSRVTVMLDSDAKREALHLASELFLRIPDVRIAKLPYGDPNDVLAHELKESLDNAEQFNGFGDVLECLE